MSELIEESGDIHALAKKLGTSVGALYHYAAGRREPRDLDMLRKIAQESGKGSDWLLMIAPSGAAEPKPNPLLAEISDVLRSLRPDERRALMAVIKTWAAGAKATRATKVG